MKIASETTDDSKEKVEMTPAQPANPELPVPVFVWRIFLVIAVFLYSSFTIFVHLCEVDGKFPFRSTSVVLLVEILKLILSIIMYGITRDAWNCHRERNVFQVAKNELRQNYKLSSTSTVENGSSALDPTRQPPPPLTWGKLLVVILPFTVPALLYAINNNLGIHIQLEMDPATYQVLGNFKILSTAILFRLIIKRPISPLQWFSLFLLLAAGFTHSHGSLLARTASSASDPAKAGTAPSTFNVLHITPLGIFMISIYCTLSGLSGVYTEYVMKKRVQMSIHMQNGLLYIFGILVNGFMFVVDVQNDQAHKSWSLFEGYSLWTWLLIVTQAVTGIFMGFVMKYSTNITRLFIISSAMLVTTFAAMLVFGLKLNLMFVLSFVLVCTSLYLYHM